MKTFSSECDRYSDSDFHSNNESDSNSDRESGSESDIDRDSNSEREVTKTKSWTVTVRPTKIGTVKVTMTDSNGNFYNELIGIRTEKEAKTVTTTALVTRIVTEKVIYHLQ